MTGDFPLVFPILISVMAVAILALAAGLLLSWKELSRQNRANHRETLDGILSLLNASSTKTEALLASYASAQATGQQEITRHVETIQSDVEWLAGERMIEQALELVRDNMPVSQISKETGLSHDKIRTLASFRAH